MSEETHISNSTQENNSFLNLDLNSLDQSRLATVLIGVLVILAGYLGYTYLNLKTTPQIPSNNQITITIQPKSGSKTIGNINPKGELETSVTPPPNQVGNFYTVQAGDSLWKIAKNKFGSGFVWVELARANHIPLDNAKLKIGQKILLPSLGTTKGATTTQGGSTPTRASVKGGKKNTYTVKAGDTLWEIAKRFYGNGHDWVRIYDSPENQIVMYTAKTTGHTYPRIEIGQKLVIPGVVS